MKISVVIPCRNAAALIGATLRSVALQSRLPDEVIVVDDGSTDSSVSVVRSSEIPARVLRCEAGNAAVARNLGIKEASGDFVAFLDAHDLWHPEHLATAEKVVGRSQGSVAYVSNVDVLDGDGQTAEQRYPPPFNEVQVSLDHMDFIEHYGGGYFYANLTKLISRRRLIEVGLHDELFRWRHDIELWLRVIHRRRWCFNPEVTGTYRMPRKGDISSKVAKTSLYTLKALLKHREQYASPTMDRHIHAAARRALTSSYMDGRTRTDISDAWSLAAPWLSDNERRLFRFLGTFPLGLRLAISLRRRLRRGARKHCG